LFIIVLGPIVTRVLQECYNGCGDGDDGVGYGDSVVDDDGVCVRFLFIIVLGPGVTRVLQECYESVTRLFQKESK
jgi:hypothetical protein